MTHSVGSVGPFRRMQYPLSAKIQKASDNPPKCRVMLLQSWLHWRRCGIQFARVTVIQYEAKSTFHRLVVQ